MTPYIEHQQSVLGAIFLEPSCLNTVSQIVSFSDFDETHGKLYQACVEVDDDGGIPDLVTISKFNLCDTEYLVKLIDFVPTSANVGYYAKSVAEFGQRRKISDILHTGISKLKEGDNPTAWIEEQLTSIHSNKQDALTIRSVLQETMKEMENVYTNGNPSGYKTGVVDLDKAGCFQDGELVVIAARPAMGKSVLGAQLLTSDDSPALILNYEMGNTQLCRRLLASESKVNLKNIKTATLTENQYPIITDAAGSLSKKKIFLCEASGLSIRDVRSKVRLMVQKHGIKKVVVDYIQLCYDEKSQSREQEISTITRNLKLMAKELDICVIALSQLNRSLEKRDNKRPMMSDLRESGAIEQDADVIIFIYRDIVYNKNAAEREAELIIAKYRDGEIGFVPCLFIGEHQRFTTEYKG